MIVHDFSIPAKQVRIDTYNFSLRVPQFETGFFSIWDFILFLMLLCYYCFKINFVSEGLKKRKNFWAGVLVEAEDTAQDTS